ncbi:MULTISPECIES: hypothetical protein [unclassified Roseofilum]|nr:MULTISPECIES: hypothetical protein [unclassified Roseofilum]
MFSNSTVYSNGGSLAASYWIIEGADRSLRRDLELKIVEYGRSQI